VELLQRRVESTNLDLGKAEQRASAQESRGDTLEKQLALLREEKPVKRKPRAKKTLTPQAG